ncbi:hypothetical protein [Alicyclobacillus fodiniaquatilis]|uniref:DUF4383 domain-containing protein n=1 Tax=Alicyclobacillus fodiniaquatilis TaxID=1661150 RepID=A0ABW4JDU1_9BACL
MNSKTTCRIIGWIFLTLGGIGVCGGHVGTYLQFTHVESYLNLAFGSISVLAARRRHRVSAATAMLTGLLYCIWGTSGLFFQHPLLGSVEPLDTIMHELAAIWGIGTAAHDVLLWRKQISSAS